MIDELRPKRIAFLTSTDAQDKRSWSGIFYQMAQALKRHCGDVVYVGPVHSEGQKYQRSWRGQVKAMVKRFVHRHLVFVYWCFAFVRGYFIHDYYLGLAKSYAKAANLRFMQEHFDVIVAPVSLTQVAFVETDIPIVIV